MKKNEKACVRIAQQKIKKNTRKKLKRKEQLTTQVDLNYWIFVNCLSLEVLVICIELKQLSFFLKKNSLILSEFQGIVYFISCRNFSGNDDMLKKLNMFNLIVIKGQVKGMSLEGYMPQWKRLHYTSKNKKRWNRMNLNQTYTMRAERGRQPTNIFHFSRCSAFFPGDRCHVFPHCQATNSGTSLLSSKYKIF